jgi:hypothetical protein
MPRRSTYTLERAGTGLAGALDAVPVRFLVLVVIGMALQECNEVIHHVEQIE